MTETENTDTAERLDSIARELRVMAQTTEDSLVAEDLGAAAQRADNALHRIQGTQSTPGPNRCEECGERSENLTHRSDGSVHDAGTLVCEDCDDGGGA